MPPCGPFSGVVESCGVLSRRRRSHALHVRAMDGDLLTLLRHVEPLRANLVAKARDSRWSSVGQG